MAVTTAATTTFCASVGALLLLRGELRVLWVQPPSILCGYWITAGAWRRTGHGRYGIGPGPADEESGLPAARATSWTVVAVASVIGVLLALGIQVAIARA